MSEIIGQLKKDLFINFIPMKREIPKHCNPLDYITALEIENKSLKEELKDFNNLIGRLERTEELNRKLKEELSKLKEKYWDLDF